MTRVAKEATVISRSSLLGLLAFLFVIPSLPEDGPYSYVFPIAVILVKGKRLALAPLFLGSFYARLDECSMKMIRFVG